MSLDAYSFVEYTSLDCGCPGGYKDSGADLAYALFLESREKRSPAIKLITPATTPDPSVDADWSFGDHKETILEVIEKRGANVLWANTTVHSTHALMELAKKYPDIMMVGQDPRHVDRYDDKAWVNRWLQSLPGLEGSYPTSCDHKARTRPWLAGRRALSFSKRAEAARTEALGDGRSRSR